MSLRVQIKKRLGDFSLDVDFSADNERLALLGGSGSGKSVTLRCIAGIMNPDEGVIELDGKVLFDSARKINLPPQARHVGYLFQQYALFPNMSALQNVRVAVGDKSKRDETAERFLRAFQLGDVHSSRPAQLSGGQQQRLALARILASEPKMLMLDEPFSALDSYMKAQLEQELADVLEHFSGNVIWVAHDRDEVFRNCSKICVIDGGRTQPVVTPKSLFFDPRTVSAAKLSGCKNIIPARPSGNFAELPCWKLSLKCSAPLCSDICAIGLRAHHVHLAAEFEDNSMACSVVRIMDNVFTNIILLRPLGAALDAPLLRMDTQKSALPNIGVNDTLTVAIAPENILLLK